MNRISWRSVPRSRLARLPPPRRQTRRCASTDAGVKTPQSRLDKINARLPRFLHRYTTPLLTAPVSHVTAFFILHELTAILPLLSLFSIFHYFQFTPPFVSDAAFDEGVQKFGGYLRRKGWLGPEEEVDADVDAIAEGKGTSTARSEGSRVLVEAACAYAITKVLLPLRLVVSVWASPWFARIFVLPVSSVAGRIFGKATKP